ncbi:protein-L-isoaspartate O-methyltransferase family protein [Nonomuraea sp. SYSU D8015]|uniref:protein-L-isoaspartate O-methyltransferase family protein n=1 Tax=Nonomuraea sp. SYSU D8015 TaxID=2593644 RepID=UPI001660FE34|nr:methyltransferase domain-containing protein [Nonomuraea sp. SYSU D8015]
MAIAMTFSSPVQHALDHVCETHYTLQSDGSKLPQTSAPEIIATMLDLLQVAPGQRVLEIGTGSGYSTALLSHLVGDTGHVTSIDIDADLIHRAEQRLRADGYTNVTLHPGDGATSAVDRPLDRIIAWASLEHIPDAWARQAVPGAIMVTPVFVTELAKTFLVVRVHRGEHDRALTADRFLQAGFVEASSYVLDQWIVPPRRVDALTHRADGRPWWLSAPWLRSGGGDNGRELLHQLQTVGRQATGPLGDQDDAADFYAYLLATRPDGLTTAALGEPLWRIGASTPAGIALITPRQAHHQLAAGDHSATELLTTWARQWRDQGKPGLDRMRAVLRHGRDGWTVRPALTMDRPACRSRPTG